MKVKNLTKLPRRKVTIDDILGLDTIKDMASDIVERAAETDALIVVRTFKHTNTTQWDTNGVVKGELIVLCSQIIHRTLANEE